MTRTVRFRVTLLAALLVLVALTVAGIALVVTQRRLLLSDLDTSLRHRAADVESLAATGATRIHPGAVDDDTAAQIVTPTGTVVAATANLEGAGAIAPAPADETLRTARGLPIDDEPFRLLSRRIETPAGARVIHVAATLDDVEESTAVLRGSLTIAVPGVTVLLAGLVWWLVGRALHPVEAIRREVSDINGSDLHRRVPVPTGNDEIARLARTMNRMLDRVEESAERQRRFVADASHELRSPLTRIRSEVEVDLAHPERADLEATHRSVLEETAALQALVDDLLVLARSDAAGAPKEDATVDLDDIVLEQARRARETGRVTVDSTQVSAAQVRGDQRALDRAIANLVDNALRHAATSVTLSLDERDGQARLMVADDGPGVPETDRERIFERFARVDDARSGAAGGTGLGLAIARDIARRHGGDVTIDQDQRPGARFVLTVPLPTANGRVG